MRRTDFVLVTDITGGDDHNFLNVLNGCFPELGGDGFVPVHDRSRDQMGSMVFVAAFAHLSAQEVAERLAAVRWSDHDVAYAQLGYRKWGDMAYTFIDVCNRDLNATR